ncbi:phage holin family protein [Methanoculleus sp.]|uniref:phage holin family protein n=1 Tax=Methanoculleus sp. TaxID=90427 RepID=UPI0025FC3305|nr:phage holin family protein [Methanoculleus sp.]MCK9320101.1 phage holin family protein [Methanoculleus sp.]
MNINIKQFFMGILPASYFLWTEQFTGACIILFLLIILDTITGIRAAQKQGLFSSGVAVNKTKTKAINYLTILLVGYLMNMFYLSLTIDGIVAHFMIDLVGGFLDCMFLLFVGFLIGVEGYSILENLAKMGQKLPKKIVEGWGKNIK